MTHLESAILGCVQGLSEFLPISSSGHLVLAADLMGLENQENGAAFEVVLHLGSLLAVFLVFRVELWALIKTLPALLRVSECHTLYAENMEYRRAVLVALATLPVVVIGLTLKSRILELFDQPLFAAAMLLVTALILLATKFLPPPQAKPNHGLTMPAALFVGCAQVLALLPGISRSGTTISAALFRGIDRDEAGRFSFFLAIPAILGAAVLELPKLFEGTEHTSLSVLTLGFLCAFVSGYWALRILLKLVVAGRFWFFAPYLAIVALSFVLFR